MHDSPSSREQQLRPRRLTGAFRYRPRLISALLVAAVLLLALAANAFARIPDHNEVYHACVQSGNLPYPGAGSIRMIDTDRGQHCNRFESPITWNAHEATGLTGPTGETGVTGPTGDTGATGPAGGIADYAYVYSTLITPIPPSDGILFNTNGTMTSGISHAGNFPYIYFGMAGTYKVTFTVTATTAAASFKWGLAINNVLVPGASYTAPAATQNITGQAIISVNDGASLTVLNLTSSPATLVGDGSSTTASVLIEKLAD